MTENGPEHDGAPGSEPEQAILELAEYAEPASPALARRVRNALLRRGLTSDLADYAWFAPLRILLEYLSLALTLMRGGAHKRGESDE